MIHLIKAQRFYAMTFFDYHGFDVRTLLKELCLRIYFVALSVLRLHLAYANYDWHKKMLLVIIIYDP